MREKIAAYLDNAITILLYVIVAFTPLIFLNLTTEPYETPKLILLSVSTILLLGLWTFSWIVKGKVVITRTPLDIPLLLLLGVVLVSTYFSNSKYPAIYGSLPKVHGSAISWVTYILFYFVTASHLKNLVQLRNFVYILLACATISSLVSVMSFFNLYLPFDISQTANFSPAGSTFSTLSFVLLLLPFALLSIAIKNKYLPMPVAIILSTFFGVVIALLGNITTFLVALVAVSLCLFVLKPVQLKKALPLLLIPVVTSAIVYGLTLLPLPGNSNIIHQKARTFPREVKLPFVASWKVSASSFRDAPFFGTGPATYLFNFTQYKPNEFNRDRFWNLRFDTAYNEYLQVLGTLGLLGLLGLMFISLIIVSFSWKNLSFENVQTENPHDSSAVQTLTVALAISGVVVVLLWAVHATTLVSIVISLVILAMLMASHKSIRGKVSEFTIGIKAQASDNRQFDLLPIIIFIAFIIFALPALYKASKVIQADYYHRQALLNANKNGALTYQHLQKAETLNPHLDTYRVDMALTNFGLANAIAANAQKKAQETNATPGAVLTAEDRRTIQTLLSQAVNEGRAAVALSPLNSSNWEVLASVYRQISGVAQNSLAFSLDAYGRAIQRDPLNPLLRLNVGGVYYSLRNYDLAIRFFSDAVNLKPDYANAYYNLSVALRDKGDLNNARLAAEQVVVLLQKDTNNPDYKVATEYLADLKARIATGSAQQAGNIPPAAQTNSALQNNQLPDVNVSDLNNPPSNIATPEAVKKNPEAKLPQSSPSPTPAATP